MIRLSKSVISRDEIQSVSRVLKNEFLGMGEEVKFFENELSIFFNSNVLCVNTGTSALQLALQSIGIGAGDEVLVQSLTYVASFQAISATGAKPIACEIDEHTLTINLNDAQKKITKNTKAIMPVHYTGSPGNLNEIYNFAKKYNLRVVEDAAHAFGTYYKNNKIGSQGDIICFSFDGIKNITCGEGGCIVTKDIDVINKIKDLRLLAVQKDSDLRYQNKRSWDFDVVEQGWRYHMSNIMAAIGRVQLTKLEKFRKKRQSISKLYSKLLKNISGIELLEINYDEVLPHIFIIKVLDGNRDNLRKNLEENKIQTGIHYKPNHLLSFYKQDKLEITENIYSIILTLPLHPDLSNKDVIYICKIIIDNLK
jgi:dTDP-4-amino-4,6-dideoxygalactose transaminase